MFSPSYLNFEKEKYEVLCERKKCQITGSDELKINDFVALMATTITYLILITNIMNNDFL